MPPRKTAKTVPAAPKEVRIIPDAPRTPFFSKPPVLIAILGTMLVSALYLWIAQPVPSTPPAVYTPPTGQNQAPEAPSGDQEDPVTRVSRMIVVNPAENPQVFTVSDAAAFQAEQPQAGAVESGDKVISWSDKTVVYSPSKDMIIAVYPTPPPVPPTPEADATVEIRNGSGVAGGAARMRNAMMDGGLAISRIGDAAVRRTEGTIVIDLSGGTKPNALSKTLELSGGTVGDLPEGEPTSEASILVIIGQ